MLCATNSGSGKTTITCGILQALVLRGVKPAAFKCGPDYIDPMFHSTVIGAKSRNIDTFFGGKYVNELLRSNSEQCDISVIEGVMGYYDGIADTTEASSYDVARTTKTPAVLIVNAAGMSISAGAIVAGFKSFAEDSQIKGVILNRISPSIYPEIKRVIEDKTGIKVYGYVPKVPELMIESRHLGLVKPEEVENLREKLTALAQKLEQSLDIDGLIELAAQAPDIEEEKTQFPQWGENVKIAVARDEAFCFYYEDNLQLLRDMGAQVVEFSPMYDEAVPENADGLIFGGGYPELYAKILSENKTMTASVKSAIEGGIPCIAECGGFMYLHKYIECMNGEKYPMCGVIDGQVYYTGKLGRFGYIDITAGHDSIIGPAGTKIRGHEFHYFDSTANGDDFHAQKPGRKKNWDCSHASGNLLCGFPHFYFYSNPECAAEFLKKCGEFRKKRG
jgi:cobyrinic acid a,c-diamide synthase